MRRLNAFAASLALPALLIGSAAVPTSLSAQTGADQSGSANQCRIDVSRSNSMAGQFDLKRKTLGNGQCVCVVKTGPASQGGEPEQALALLNESKDCANAPAAEAAGAGMNATAYLVGGAVLIGGGVAAIVASDKQKSK